MLAKKLKKRKTTKKKKEKKFPGLLAVVFVAFAVYLAYTNIMIFLERARINSEYVSLNNIHGDLEKEKEVLKMQLGETYTDEYVERVAREDLGLYKQGEKVIVIKKDEGQITEMEGKVVEEKKDMLTQVFDFIREVVGK